MFVFLSSVNFSLAFFDLISDITSHLCMACLNLPLSWMFCVVIPISSKPLRTYYTHFIPVSFLLPVVSVYCTPQVVCGCVQKMSSVFPWCPMLCSWLLLWLYSSVVCILLLLSVILQFVWWFSVLILYVVHLCFVGEC